MCHCKWALTLSLDPMIFLHAPYTEIPKSATALETQNLHLPMVSSSPELLYHDPVSEINHHLQTRLNNARFHSFVGTSQI